MIPGVVMLLGKERTINFCMQKHKMKGLSCFTAGLFMVNPFNNSYSFPAYIKRIA